MARQRSQHATAAPHSLAHRVTNVWWCNEHHICQQASGLRIQPCLCGVPDELCLSCPTGESSNVQLTQRRACCRITRAQAMPSGDVAVLTRLRAGCCFGCQAGQLRREAVAQLLGTYHPALP
jgi:hypothetical protein